MQYSSSDHIPIMKDLFPMTMKGVAVTCLGDVFENEEELDKLSTAYHKCWREIEVTLNVWQAAGVGPKEMTHLYFTCIQPQSLGTD